MTTDQAGQEVFGASLYAAQEAEGATSSAVSASLGCGVPTAVADLHPGETVLDLGSGGGADVLISARRVALTGNAIGLDMTDEMLAFARANAAEAGVDNVEFIKGYIEAIPLSDASVDVVISNCVINLAADKHRVLAEAARVLRPGGRFAVSDVIADTDMDEATRADMAAYTGCIAGALTERGVSRRTYRRRPRRRRDSSNSSRPCACQLGDHPSAQASLGLTRRVLTAFAAATLDLPRGTLEPARASIRSPATRDSSPGCCQRRRSLPPAC